MVSVTVDFWRNKKIFVTGHTGFKGSWLSHWLLHLGAKVHGYALAAPTNPSLYELSGLSGMVSETIADIRSADKLIQAMTAFAPDIVFHMAAQPLVRDSYDDPVGTYSTNVMGTINVLEAVRKCPSVRAFINITTDKCYENREWVWGYRENEALGGFDPYSSSKACSEILTASYRRSFFKNTSGGIGIATARAGNVIGGGDFAKDRLIPDCVRSALAGEKITIRYPNAIRPWQHVLEPLGGYMLLAEKLFEMPARFSEAYNFGPEDSDTKPVEWIVQKFCEKWPGASYAVDGASHPHEAHFLKLDISKARTELQFRPRWSLEKSIDRIVQWTRAYVEGNNLRNMCIQQINEYSQA
ncbi:MAG: CDP-glucose 4,6-dehydratase [Turneriella sp.]|nr:CDP-glucose 4,6-dehydratase [Turneriella sp.]